MSLISEALRKARLEAAEREANEARAAGTGASAPPARNGRFGTGLILGALIAVAASMIGAGGVWWLSTTRADGQGEAGAGAERTLEHSAVREEDTRPREVADGGLVVPEQERELPVASTQGPAESGEATAEIEEESLDSADDQSGARASEGPGESVVAEDRGGEPVQSSSLGERVFVVNADLGYAVLTLDYIVFREHNPYAQINGLEVHVGAVVEGFTVLEVTRQSVRLQDDRGELLLRVR